jgi:hypothetical protein
VRTDSVRFAKSARDLERLTMPETTAGSPETTGLFPVQSDGTSGAIMWLRVSFTRAGLRRPEARRTKVLMQ